MLPPLLAWGLCARGIGAVYAIAFASIAVQITALSGAQGCSPFWPLLIQIKHDFPHTYWFRFPSLFWLVGASDAALVAVPAIGTACGLAVLVGLHSHAALLYALLALRSLDLPVGLLYPWDSLLLETGALALLLPAVPPCWSHGAALDAAPHPWLAAAVRFLLARLLLGFGKKKFVGTSLKHSCYIKNFLLSQPIPSPAGWVGYRMPLPIFQAALALMFVVECVAPLCLFGAGPARAYAAASIGTLMVGIQLGGNFGYFNALTIALCMGCLDDTSSHADPLPPAGLNSGAALAELGTRAALAAYAALGTLFFAFDSWCSTSWPYWPELATAQRPVVRTALSVCRAVADLRLVHAYGVFPPASNPPVRMAPVLEGSLDGLHWRRYEWAYLPCGEHSKPRFVAPHHPRIDHSLFYASFGTGPDNFLCTINTPRPYSLGRDSFLHRTARALLSAAPGPRRLLRHDPFPAGGPPPRFVRARLFALRPASLAQAANGRYWEEACIDPVHLPTLCLEGDAVPPPPPPGRRPISPGRGAAQRSKSAGRSPAPGLATAAAMVTVAVEAPPPTPPPLCAGARDPLLIHPDLMPVWRARFPMLRALLSAPLEHKGREGVGDFAWVVCEQSVTQFATANELDVTTLTEAFWGGNHRTRRTDQRGNPGGFVGAVARVGTTSDWGAADWPGRVGALRAKYSPAQLHAFELMLGGLMLRMMPVLEAHHRTCGLPKLGGAAPSYFHLALLCHTLVLLGEDATSRMLQHGAAAAAAAADGVAATVPAGEAPRELLAVDAGRLQSRGLSFYAVLWHEMLLFHARKRHVSYQMQQKYGPPMATRHPTLIPGFMTLLPVVGEALAPHACEGQAFPQWAPPGPMGDWTPKGEFTWGSS